MMNYRHAFHAGNFADVLKHAVLCLVLDYLARKDKPFRVIDTHAGTGIYDLTAEEALRSPEWQEGIGRLLQREDPPAALLPLLQAVQTLNGGEAVSRYPGSPWLAGYLTRPGDHVRLCELHPVDVQTLKANMARWTRVAVEARDGYQALKAFLPPVERRGLVLIDPPFEARDEFETALGALAEARRRWPGGTYLIWRPLKRIEEADAFDLAALAETDAETGLRADLWVRSIIPTGPLVGAGLIVINPPYLLRDQLAGLLPYLAETLSQGPGAGWRLDNPAGPRP
jgi:23S rRNA (adenine2030-N6)-methyltransferase